MKILGFNIGSSNRKAPVQKGINYGDVFAHGLPMDLFWKQVVRPYESIATVYKAVKALCDNVPQAKIVIYNKATNEEIDDVPLRTLLENPNPRQTQSDFLQEWVGYYALTGEGFIKKVRSLGQVAGIMRSLPAELVNLDPSKMKESMDFNTLQLTGWKYGTTLLLTLEEIIHTKDFNPYNPNRGMSPLKPIADEMEIDQASLTFNNSFFKNNATAGMILSTEGNLTQDQRDALRKSLEARHTGVANSFKNLLLEKGLKPIDAGRSTHREMEFIEQKKLMREEILGIWRTPKALFNITDDLNYATFMGQMRVFWLYGLMPIMRKFEDSINKNIVQAYNPNLRVVFDYKNTPAFQQDFNERVATGQILSQIGFTGNEINDKLELGFEEQEWRDKWWVSFGLVPADAEATAQREADKLAQEEADRQANAEAQAKLDEEAGKEEAGKEKAVRKTALTERKSKFIKVFLKGQGSIEKMMESKITRYLMDLRAKILKDPAHLRTLSMVDWDKQDEVLVKLIKPVMHEGIKLGVAIGQDVLGRTKTLDDANFEHRVNSLLQIRMDKLTGINSTIKNRLQDKLKDTLTEQVQAGASVSVQTSTMQEAVREFFNLTSSRALLIARTESSGAVNGGSMLYYQNEGVTQKEWITSQDELVRESHRQCEDEGAISMFNTFSNGLMFPSDQNGDAGEVCNCRCSLLPVVE